MGLIVSSKDGSEAQLIRRQYSNAYPSPQHRFSASGEGGCCLSAKVSDSTCYIAQLETEHDEDGDEDEWPRTSKGELQRLSPPPQHPSLPRSGINSLSIGDTDLSGCTRYDC